MQNLRTLYRHPGAWILLGFLALVVLGIVFILSRCSTTDLGYACSLTKGEARYGAVEQTFERTLTTICFYQNGRYACPGRCLPADERFCDTKSAVDSGVGCTNDSQCTYGCREPEGEIIGACRAYPDRL